MRRLVRPLPLALLPFLPVEAKAQDPFCASLRQLTVAAAEGFANVPRNAPLLPGSIEHRRGIVETGTATPRAVVYMVMVRDQSRRHPSHAEQRFQALAAEIPRCLPEANATGASDQGRGATRSWQTSQAVIGLRLDRGEGDLSNAEVEVSVASRW